MKKFFALFLVASTLAILDVCGCSRQSLPQAVSPYTIDNVHWTMTGKYNSGTDWLLSYSFTVHNNTTNSLDLYLDVQFLDNMGKPDSKADCFDRAQLTGYGVENFASDTYAESTNYISGMKIQEDKEEERVFNDPYLKHDDSGK
jgi:hypothetical protein